MNRPVLVIHSVDFKGCSVSEVADLSDNEKRQAFRTTQRILRAFNRFARRGRCKGIPELTPAFTKIVQRASKLGWVVYKESP